MKKKFRFYCPLCMLHFSEVFETACCGNYVCHACALEYVLRVCVQLSVMVAVLASNRQLVLLSFFFLPSLVVM